MRIHCCSTLRLLPTRTRQPRRVASASHAPRPSRGWSYRFIGFKIAVYHNYDAEVGGHLKGLLKDTFKKGTFLLHQNQLSKEVADRRSALAELAPLFLAEQAYGEYPATNSCSHHVDTEKVEEFTPFCEAASSNRALSHTAVPLGTLPSLLCDVAHSTSAVTLGRIVSCYADGGRALELLFFFLCNFVE